MNVYVESNFVLEQALEQEQCESCEELLRLASAGSIRLVVPAFSLAEPHIALMRRESERSRLRSELQRNSRKTAAARSVPVLYGTAPRPLRFKASFRAGTIEDLP